MLARLRTFLQLFNEKDKTGAETLLALARVGSIVVAGIVAIWGILSFTGFKSLHFPAQVVAEAPEKTSRPSELPTVALKEAPPTIGGSVQSLRGSTPPVMVKTESFEQRGTASQRACDGTIMLSVEPYRDVSARPDRADEFTQVTMSVDGGTPQIHDLGKTLPLSAQCRLTGLQIFRYAQRSFGVEGTIEIGDFE